MSIFILVISTMNYDLDVYGFICCAEQKSLNVDRIKGVIRRYT